MKIQCTMQNNNNTRTGWINSNKIKIGSRVKIKNDDRWWAITQMGKIMPDDSILEREQDYLHHRNATDI